MNICMLTGTFHPIIGGAETYLRTIAEGMYRAGHNVIVLTDGTESKLPQQELLEGIQILRASSYISLLHAPDKIRWEQMYFGLLSEFHSLLAGKKIDIIHANSLDCAIIGSMLALSLHIPLVCSFHEQEPENEPFGEGKCRLVFSKLPVDIFIAGSQFYIDRTKTYDVPTSKARLIYHGINLTTFYPHSVDETQKAKSAMGIEHNNIFVVCVGRLKQRKGLLELVQALRIVKDTFPNIQALIAGSCNSASREYANTLYQEIKNLGLTGNIRIDETLVFDDMPDLYAAADIVVQPSYAEGLGLAILEAMASGKPIIGSDTSGIREIIIHEHNGLLVPPKQVEPLADAIIQLATNHYFAKQLAEEGMALVKSLFDIRRTIHETDLIYHELVEGKRTSNS